MKYDTGNKPLDEALIALRDPADFVSMNYLERIPCEEAESIPETLPELFEATLVLCRGRCRGSASRSAASSCASPAPAITIDPTTQRTAMPEVKSEVLRQLFAGPPLREATDDDVERFKNRSDDDVLRAANTPNSFAIVEATRRLRNALVKEERVIKRLTRWLVAFTVVLVLLTAALVWDSFERRMIRNNADQTKKTDQATKNK